MLDRHLTPLLHAPLSAMARALVRRGVGADTVTFAGFTVGLVAAFFIANEHYLTGLAGIFVSRWLDGLDGALARCTRSTDAGGFLDITLDFVFYATVPLAFAVADPGHNALPAAVLLAGFIGTGSSFLAYAVMAAKHGRAAAGHAPNKSLYFLGGLTEATETLLCFTAMCLWPTYFAPLAYGFACLCGMTTVTRIAQGYRDL